jgi:hypothetical protein
MVYFFLLFLSLASCIRSGPWAFDQVHSDDLESRSTRLAHRSKTPVNGIDVEILKTHEHLNVFLNIRSIPIPAQRQDPKHATLFLTIQGTGSTHQVYRLEGGQRFLLDAQTTALLLEALKNNQEVSLSLCSYRTTLASEGFAKKLDQLLHPFPIQNPFHLPM